MLQRLVRSTVSTVPRPYLIEEAPCRWMLSSSADLEIAAEKQALDAARKGRIGREHILEGAVLLADLAHQDASVFLDKLGLDFARADRAAAPPQDPASP